MSSSSCYTLKIDGLIWEKKVQINGKHVTVNIIRSLVEGPEGDSPKELSLSTYSRLIKIQIDDLIYQPPITILQNVFLNF